MSHIKQNPFRPTLSPRMRRQGGVALVAALAATVVLAGCASGSTDADATAAASPSSSSATAFNEEAASLVPADMEGATLTVAFEAANLPWTDFNEDKTTAQGLNYDLINAIGTVLGLEATFEGTSFSNLIPGIQGGRYDIAASGIFDTAEREQIVDAVSYATDGEMLVVKKGGDTDLTQDTLCGLSIAVAAGTVMAEGLPVVSEEECVAAGKEPIDVQVYPSQQEIFTAVSAGRADALNTSSSTGGYLISINPGIFEQSGPTYNDVPIALILAKDSPMSEAISAAINVLIEDGTYEQIFTEWGQEAAMNSESQVNLASSK